MRSILRNPLLLLLLASCIDGYYYKRSQRHQQSYKRSGRCTRSVVSTCPSTSRLTNGQVIGANYPNYQPKLGTRLSFKCARGHVINGQRETEIECALNSRKQLIWQVTSTKEEIWGCRWGCLYDRDCDWGMRCNMTNHECQYKTCPEKLVNAQIFFGNNELNLGGHNRLGSLATISCDQGFFVEHPDEFVALARKGFKIDDRNVQVQCHEKSDRGAEWFVLYRRSAGLQASVYDDVLQTSEVPVKCIRGCLLDSQCPERESCFERQCVPRVCPRVLPVAHTVLMMRKTANVGVVVKARCEHGYVLEHVGLNVPFSLLCAAHPDPRHDPHWLLIDSQSSTYTNNMTLRPTVNKSLRCVRRNACERDEMCAKFFMGVEKCFDGECVEHCVDPCHGHVHLDKSVDYNLGQIGSLRCDAGYVSLINDVHEVKCVYDVHQGARWIYTEKATEAQCISGCTSDKECNVDQFCQERQCRTMTCSPISVNNGKFVKDDSKLVGSKAKVVCAKGHLIRDNVNKKIKKSVDVVCQAMAKDFEQNREAAWVDDDNFASHQCVPGCMDDSDCSANEYCDETKHMCKIIACECFSSDANLKFVDCQNSAKKAGEVVRVECKNGFVFRNDSSCSKSSQLICDPRSRAFQPLIANSEVQCESGCTEGAKDCTQRGLGHCENCNCKPTLCKSFANDKHSSFERISNDEVLKKCHKGFRLNNDQRDNEIRLVCDRSLDPDNPRWVTHKHSLEEPRCTHYCTKDSQCKKGKEKCLSGNCIDLTCDFRQIEHSEVDLKHNDANGLGERAMFTCHRGFVFKSGSSCSRSQRLTCTSTSSHDSHWTHNKDNDNKCVKGCVDNMDCDLDTELCSNCECVAKVCEESSRKMFGSITFNNDENKEKVAEVGSRGHMMNCSEGRVYRSNDGVAKAVEIGCKNDRERPTLVHINANGMAEQLQQCQKGCLNDCDCGYGYHCQDFKCQALNCLLDDPNSLAITSSGLSVISDTIIVQCRANRIMRIKNDNNEVVNIKRIEAKCVVLNNCGDGFEAELRIAEDFSQKVPKCLPGCAINKDCDGGEICERGACVVRKTCDYNTVFANGKIVEIDSNNVTDKEENINNAKFVCDQGFATDEGNEIIDVICVADNEEYDDDSIKDLAGKTLRWAPKQNPHSFLPRCCPCPQVGPCHSHCPEMCSAELQPHLSSSSELLMHEGNLIGAKASLLCNDGYTINNKCVKHLDLRCSESHQGPQWLLKGDQMPPKCRRLDEGVCCDDSDCDIDTERCIDGHCRINTCSSAMEHGQVLKARHTLGSVGNLMCSEKHKLMLDEDNYVDSIKVICAMGRPPKWTTIEGGSLPPCRPYCTLNSDCGEDAHCDLSLNQCRKGSECRAEAMNNGLVVINDFDEATFVCRPRHYINMKISMISVTCVEGQWLNSDFERPQCLPGCRDDDECVARKCVFGRCVDESNVCDPDIVNHLNLVIDDNNNNNKNNNVNDCVDENVVDDFKSGFRLRCKRGYKMLLPSTNRIIKSLNIECTKKGWSLGEDSGRLKSEGELPKCIKACPCTNPNLTCDSRGVCVPKHCNYHLDSLHGKIREIHKNKNVFKCNKGYRGRDHNAIVKCNKNMKWIGVDNKREVRPCNMRKSCKNDDHCPLGYKCTDSSRCEPINCSSKPSFALDKMSKFVMESSLSIGAKAWMECKPNFVLDIGINRFDTATMLVCGENGLWLTWPYLNKVKPCRPGCSSTSECESDSICDPMTAKCVQKPSLCPSLKIERSSNISINRTSSIMSLDCPSNHFLSNAGTISQKSSTKLICKKHSNNAYYWTGENGIKVMRPKCRPRQCLCRSDQICTNEQQCVKTCNIDDIDNNLQIIQNNALKNNKMVEIGKGVTVMCRQANHNLVQKMENEELKCFGSRLQLFCKASNGSDYPTWQVTNSNNGANNDNIMCMQRCRPELESCSCTSSMQECHNLCRVCIEKRLDECQNDDECIKDEEICGHINDDDNEFKNVCLPKCGSNLPSHSNIVYDDLGQVGKMRCEHHFEPVNSDYVDSKDNTVNVMCDRSVCPPRFIPSSPSSLGSIIQHDAVLPECEFNVDHCDISSLEFVAGASVDFVAGNNDGKFVPSKANLFCPELGNVLFEQHSPLKRDNQCTKNLELVCSEGADAANPIWSDSTKSVKTEDLYCAPGCLSDLDCERGREFCHKESCQCKLIQCPKHVDNGHLLYNDYNVDAKNKIQCDSGHVLDWGDISLLHFLECLSGQRTCVSTKDFEHFTRIISVQCITKGNNEAQWVMADGHGVGEPRPDQLVPECIEGCVSDTDCGPKEECLVVDPSEKNEKSGAKGRKTTILGICAPLRCSLPNNKRLKGSLEDHKFSQVGEKAEWVCNKGYHMPDIKETRIKVQCRVIEDSNSTLPMWLTEEQRPITACSKHCSSDGDCNEDEDSNDLIDDKNENLMRCDKTRNECVLRTCPSTLPKLQLKLVKEGNLRLDSKARATCELGYVMKIYNLEENIVGYVVKKNVDVKCIYDEVMKDALWVDQTTNEPLVCQPGCVSDEDCSDIRHRCDTHQGHECIPKTCDSDPGLTNFLGLNSNLSLIIGTKTQVKCIEGHIIKENKGKSLEIECKVDDKGPNGIWRAVDLDQIPQCVPGCIEHNDCHWNEFCSNSLICEQLSCVVPGSLVASGCGQSVLRVNEKCVFKASDGHVVFHKGHKTDPKKHAHILCSIKDRKKRSTELKVPQETRGCHPDYVATDCLPHQTCSVEKGYRCVSKQCSTSMLNGLITTRPSLSPESGQTTGQRAKLSCKEDFVLKTNDGNGQIMDKSEINVVCKYKEDENRSKRPYWMLENSNKDEIISCDYMCTSDRDCTQSCFRACRRHKCVNTCCNTKQIVSNQLHLCNSNTNNRSFISVGEKIEICCNDGFIVNRMDKENNEKQATIECKHGNEDNNDNDNDGARLDLTDVCVPGCTKESQDRDCNADSICNKSRCEQLTCGPTAAKNGILELSKSCSNKGLASVGCEGRFVCNKGFVYKNDKVSRGTFVKCQIAQGSRALFKAISVKGEESDLRSCIKGCVNHQDCNKSDSTDNDLMTELRVCNRNFECEQAQCSNRVPTAMNAANFVPNRREGSRGALMCRRGFIMRLPNGEMARSTLFKCCRQKHNNLSYLEWGRNSDCGQLDFSCESGCIVDDEVNKESKDCDKNEMCENHTCKIRTCKLGQEDKNVRLEASSKDKNELYNSKKEYNDNGNLLRASTTSSTAVTSISELLPGQSGTLHCLSGFTFYPNSDRSAKKMLVKCITEANNGEPQLVSLQTSLPIPKCQIGCGHKSECSENEECVRGMCISGCNLPNMNTGKFVDIGDNEMEKMAHVGLGQHVGLLCNRGYLTGAGLKSNEFTCVVTEEGANLCEAGQGICQTPKCLSGCLSNGDCLSDDSCLISPLCKGHPKCCQPIQCDSQNLDEMVGPNGRCDVSNDNYNVGMEVRCECNDDHVFMPNKNNLPDALPSNIMRFACEPQTGSNRTNLGVWRSLINHVYPVCQRGCVQDANCGGCQTCRRDKWQCENLRCDATLENAILIMRKEDLAEIKCNKGYLLATKEGLKRELGLQCTCQNDQLNWISTDDNELLVKGCQKLGCIDNEDCLSDEHICSNKECVESPCDLDEINGEVVAMHNKIDNHDNNNKIGKNISRIYELRCAQNNFIDALSPSGQLIDSSLVQCCFNKQLGRKHWTAIGNECGDQNVKCDQKCSNDDDCGSNEVCRMGINHRRCVSLRCTRPHEQRHGSQTDFEKDSELGTVNIFRCDQNYAMKPSFFGQVARREIYVICQKIVDPQQGFITDFRLEDGAKIPICEKELCVEDSDCNEPGEKCIGQKCVAIECSSIITNSYGSKLILRSDEDNEIGSQAIMECNKNHVVRIRDQCRKRVEVMCTIQARVPQWRAKEDATDPIGHCFRGCAEDGDCLDKDYYCDQLSCKCRRRICPFLLEDGLIRDVTSVEAGVGKAVWKCFDNSDDSVDNDKDVEVECVSEEDRAEWRTINDHQLPPSCDLTLINEDEDKSEQPCHNDQDCKWQPGSVCIDEACVPQHCSLAPLATTLPLAAGFNLDLAENIELNRVVTLRCNEKGHLLGGKYRWQMWQCRLVEDKVDLLPIELVNKENLDCIPGCIESSDCDNQSRCENNQCVPITCKPYISSTTLAGYIIVETNSKINAKAKLICLRGHHYNGQREIDVHCGVINEELKLANWVISGDKNKIAGCTQGCVDDHDCPADNVCDNNVCRVKTCDQKLVDSNTTTLLQPSSVTHGAQMSIRCKEGHKFVHNKMDELDVICDANHGSPSLMLNGNHLHGRIGCKKVCKNAKNSQKVCDYNEECQNGLCIDIQHCSDNVNRLNGKTLFRGDNIALNSYHEFVCNKGFVIDPSQVNGEIVKRVTVVCNINNDNKSFSVPELIMVNGDSVPECIPGCQSSSDCEKGQICEGHHCVVLQCPLMSHFDEVIMQYDDNKRLLGSAAVMDCLNGYYASTNASRLTLVCGLNHGKPTWMDLQGTNDFRCIQGCKLDEHCRFGDKNRCHNNKCVQCLSDADCDQDTQCDTMTQRCQICRNIDGFRSNKEQLSKMISAVTNDDNALITNIDGLTAKKECKQNQRCLLMAEEERVTSENKLSLTRRSMGFGPKIDCNNTNETNEGWVRNCDFCLCVDKKNFVCTSRGCPHVHLERDCRVSNDVVGVERHGENENLVSHLTQYKRRECEKCICFDGQNVCLSISCHNKDKIENENEYGNDKEEDDNDDNENNDKEINHLEEDDEIEDSVKNDKEDDPEEDHEIIPNPIDKPQKKSCFWNNRLLEHNKDAVRWHSFYPLCQLCVCDNGRLRCAPIFKCWRLKSVRAELRRNSIINSWS